MKIKRFNIPLTITRNVLRIVEVEETIKGNIRNWAYINKCDMYHAELVVISESECEMELTESYIRQLLKVQGCDDIR